MQLNKVSLRYCRFQDGICDYLTAPLLINKKLYLMDLTGNELTDIGIEDMCRYLDNSKPIKLNALRLNSNKITNRGATRLIDCFRLNQSLITELGL